MEFKLGQHDIALNLLDFINNIVHSELSKGKPEIIKLIISDSTIY